MFVNSYVDLNIADLKESEYKILVFKFQDYLRKVRLKFDYLIGESVYCGEMGKGYNTFSVDIMFYNDEEIAGFEKILKACEFDVKFCLDEG